MSELSYNPIPTAEKIHADTHEIIFIDGAWGTGKSHVAIWDCFIHNMRYPGHDALVIRDTYSALRDSCIKDFLKVFTGTGEFRVGPPPNFRWYSPLQGEVMFRSAEDPRDVQKFMSVPAGYVWIEEVCPGISIGGIHNQGIPQELFAGIYARVRDPHFPRRLLLTSAPPPNTDHWTYQLFYDNRSAIGDLSETELQSLIDSVTHYNIPKHENEKNLTPGYYEKLLPLLTGKDQIERFIEGKPGSSGGASAVYPRWSDYFHIKRVLQPERAFPIVRGWDGGLTPACVWLQFLPGKLLVLAELQGESVGIEDFAPSVVTVGKTLFGDGWKYQDYCDPAMLIRSQNDGKTCQDFVRPYGIVFRPGLQDPDLRIHAVRGWLSKMDVDGGSLRVHHRCARLIAGFRGGYRFRTIGGVSTGRVEKNEHSHLHDALQYPVSILGSAVPAQAQRWPEQLRTSFLGGYAPGPSIASNRSGLSRYSRRV